MNEWILTTIYWDHTKSTFAFAMYAKTNLKIYLSFQTEWVFIATWLSWKSQFSSVTESCLTLCNPVNCSISGLPVHHQLLEFANSSPLSQWCHQTISSSVVPFSSCLHSFPASGSFQMSQLFAIRWPKYWSFSFNISPSNKHSGLISFRMDWLNLPEVQGTLRSLLQHHISKASILQCSAFLTVQLSHPFMTTGKTIALTRRTFIGKVMSLLFKFR